jgi:hypothetical protein
VKRFSLALLVTGLAISACLVSATPAAAKQACYHQVIQDWFDNGRIDGTYPIACYRQALDHLPLDVQEYADAHDVITRALTAALSKQGSNNHPGGTATTPTTGTDTTSTSTTSTDTTATPPGSSGPSTPSGGSTGHKDAVFTKAIKRLGPSNANSIPLPLIVLGTLALLLLAAGAAGIVARKLQERRVTVTPAGSPPPDAPPAT